MYIRLLSGVCCWLNTIGSHLLLLYFIISFTTVWRSLLSSTTTLIKSPIVGSFSRPIQLRGRYSCYYCYSYYCCWYCYDFWFIIGIWLIYVLLPRGQLHIMNIMHGPHDKHNGNKTEQQFSFLSLVWPVSSNETVTRVIWINNKFSSAYPKPLTTAPLRRPSVWCTGRLQCSDR